MPTSEVLERFIARVEANAHVEAIAEFYAEGASMRENFGAPRVGRERLIENERNVLTRVKSVRSTCVPPALVNGDTVVLRWIFEFETHDGRVTRLEELAYQTWDGDRIVDEQFFYDPAQLARPEAS